MKRLGLAALFALVASSLAMAGSPTEAELHSRGWWVKQGAAELPKITNAKYRDYFYRAMGSAAESVGDYDLAAQMHNKIEELRKTDPKIEPFGEPEVFLMRAKVRAQAVVGNSEAAILEARRSGKVGVEEVIGWLVEAEHMDAVRALAKDKDLGPLCAETLFQDALNRNDKAAAAEAYALMPKGGSYMSLNWRVSNSFSFLGPIDAARPVLMLQLMPEGKERGAAASNVIHTLASKGFTKEALTIAPFVMERRGEMISALARALAAEGKIEDARTLVESEKDPAALALANYGLAVGLALHGDGDEARKVLATIPQGKIRGNGMEFSAALAAGALIKGDAKGAEQLAALPDEEQTTRIITEMVGRLIKWNKIAAAFELNSAYPTTAYKRINEKGFNFYTIAAAAKSAKDDAVFKKAVKALDALQALVTDEKDKVSAASSLAVAHCALDDVDAAIKFAAALPTADARDKFRLNLVENLGEVGAYQSVTKLMASYEGKLNVMVYVEPYRRVLWKGMGNDFVNGAAEWIASWPDAEARCAGYLRGAELIGEANVRWRAAKAAVGAAKPK